MNSTLSNEAIKRLRSQLAPGNEPQTDTEGALTQISELLIRVREELRAAIRSRDYWLKRAEAAEDKVQDLSEPSDDAGLLASIEKLRTQIDRLSSGGSHMSQEFSGLQRAHELRRVLGDPRVRVQVPTEGSTEEAVSYWQQEAKSWFLKAEKYLGEIERLGGEEAVLRVE